MNELKWINLRNFAEVAENMSSLLDACITEIGIQMDFKIEMMVEYEKSRY